MSVLTDMLGMIPEFVKDDPMMQAYYEAVAPELETLFTEGLAVPGQAWVLTVTWAIDRLERIFGIISDPSAALDIRRAALTARLRAGPISTLACLRAMAESYQGTSIEITEDPTAYTLNITTINNLDFPARLDLIVTSILTAIPAHLKILFTAIARISCGIAINSSVGGIGYSTPKTGTIPAVSTQGGIDDSLLSAAALAAGSLYRVPMCGTALNALM